MKDIMPIELMIQKDGISAYLRLKPQLEVQSAAQNKKYIPHLQYWENPIEEYKIKLPMTDLCNTRVWEKIYNVHLESLEGGSKYLRHSEYTVYTDGSKKEEGMGEAYPKR